MTQSRKRVLFGSAVGALTLPLLIASLAYACTSLATLSVHPASAMPGAVVNGTGKNFAPHGSDAPSTEPVELHFNSRTGPLLWSGRPDAAGNIAFTFTVPDASPGAYTLIATQVNSLTGAATSGTPARVSFTVEAPATAAGSALPVASDEPAATPAPAPAAAAAPAATPAPVHATATASAPRVRVAPKASAAPAPSQAAAPVAAAVVPPAPPTPTQQNSAPVATPVPPAPAPAPVTPATTPARRTVVASGSGGSSAVPFVLIGVGLVLALGATALVLAGRRSRKAPARAER
ncbi:MAG TPA: hypothetical protein VFJ85_05915 [Acidimicrobiales bacterium]|nr:hypothetical protein [Acidimicrobiales bacterium]